MELDSTSRRAARARSIFVGHLELRPSEFEVLVEGRRVGLTRREFQTFLVLVEQKDHVVRRPDIHAAVWGGPMAPRDRAVDVFVRKLRIKLERASPDWAYIHTHFGIGYRFSPEPRRAGDAAAPPA